MKTASRTLRSSCGTTPIMCSRPTGRMLPGFTRAQEICKQRGNRMKATQLLHNEGQSLWLDNITRDLLDRGTLKQYINELSVTGLTSNPTIFDHAIKNGATYDSAIIAKLAK